MWSVFTATPDDGDSFLNVSYPFLSDNKKAAVAIATAAFCLDFIED